MRMHAFIGSALVLLATLTACGSEKAAPSSIVTVAVSSGADPAFLRAGEVSQVEEMVASAFVSSGVSRDAVNACLERTTLVVEAPRADWAMTTGADGSATITVPSDFAPEVGSCLSTGAFPGLLYKAARECLGDQGDAIAARDAYVEAVSGASCLR